MEEYDLDALLDEMQGSETLNECLDRITTDAYIKPGNSLHGFWNPTEAARLMPVTTIKVNGSAG